MLENKSRKFWIGYMIVSLILLGTVFYSDQKEMKETEGRVTELITRMNEMEKRYDEVITKTEEQIKLMENIIEDSKYTEKYMYTTNALNVRKGAGTSYDIVKVYPWGEKIKIYEEEGNNSEWILVDRDKKLYVNKKYLSDSKPVPKVIEPKKEENTKTTVKARIANESSVTPETKVASASTTSAYTSMNVNTRSGLSASQIDSKLSGTALSGLGSAIADIENTYGINAYFTMAVASHESAVGTSSLARNNNNLFGFKNGSSGWASYGSKSQSIYAFGKTISKYFSSGRTSISSINTRYCPDDNYYWSGKVVWFMNKYITL